MLIVSTGEFRGNQKSYLDKVDNGTELIIQRSKNRAYKIIPVEEDDSLMTKEEFFARVDAARAEYDEGKFISFKSDEDMLSFFEKL
ncbi:MAG: type II toxin-antitoxin system Phd/YefM family antitoxin [Rikenellaceae bacterium]|jgi:PHD/YefM family antitoxin component YafN of YafNO toxin-antitoxin module|nr:type II toxin-antitoxin system Phd/YefM family antitoxin [Rikenellaceae bacterium]